MFTRRSVLTGLAVLVSAAPAIAIAQERVVRMGYQKVGAFALLKVHGILEERLKPLGYTVTWKEFPGGPQLLEGLKEGAVDFAHSGEAPPIFAQAAGTPLLYIGYVPDGPKSEAILVPKDSPIKTVADLKGRKIGLNKGSNVHYLLVRVLDKAGLKYPDIELVFLPPADGRAAFEKGAIDAWVIWEPYRTAAEMSLGARSLADGTGLVSNNDFLFVAKSFAQAHPQVIDVVLGATRDVFAQAAMSRPRCVSRTSDARTMPPRATAADCSRLPHSITVLASEIIVPGTVRPSACAVFRLPTNSNLVGRAIRRSAGFSPLRMRPA
jgi:sulfonate transport system substrate-binding protein